MPVDMLLARYGDLAFDSALAVYVLAMLLHAAEFSLGRRLAPLAAPAPVGVLVGAGAPATVPAVPHPDAPAVPPLAHPDPPAVPSGRPPAERAGRMAVALTVLGVLLNAGSLALRGLAAHRPPWGNMYEFSGAICLVAVVAWLVVLYRHTRSGRAAVLRRLGLYVLLPVVVLMLLAGTVLYVPAAPVMPALQSYWLAIHVSAASVASGILLVAGVSSTLFVLRSSGRLARLPSADALDRVAYRATTLAFPVWTFAIMTGAIWAESAWGKYWGWDPKETTALIAWVAYAAYLHARATAGWRGRPAAVINVIGFAVMLFNLFFINFVTTGLHSYAGVG